MIASRSGPTARKRSGARRVVSPADQCAGQHESRLPAQQDRGNLDRSVRQQPPRQERRLASRDVVRRHRAENHAVEEEQDQGAGAPRDAERHGQNGHADVVGHQLRGKGRLHALEAVFFGAALPCATRSAGDCISPGKGRSTALVRGSWRTANQPNAQPSRVMAAASRKAPRCRRKARGKARISLRHRCAAARASRGFRYRRAKPAIPEIRAGAARWRRCRGAPGRPTIARTDSAAAGSPAAARRRSGSSSTCRSTRSSSSQ